MIASPLLILLGLAIALRLYLDILRVLGGWKLCGYCLVSLLTMSMCLLPY